MHVIISIKRVLEGILFLLIKIFYIVTIPVRPYSSWLVRVIRMSWWKMRLSSLGNNTKIYPSVVMHGSDKIKIGSNVAIAEFVHMWGAGDIEIGDNTIIAAHAIITSQTHDTKAYLYKDTQVWQTVKIGERVWIGTGAIILPGITIGDGAIIGAGSVVTHDVEKDSIVAGVPAQLLRYKEK